MEHTATKQKITAQKPGSKAAPDVVGKSKPSASTGNRDEHIATAAYYKAQARGFASGQELDDWLQAEAESKPT